MPVRRRSRTKFRIVISSHGAIQRRSESSVMVFFLVGGVPSLLGLTLVHPLTLAEAFLVSCRSSKAASCTDKEQKGARADTGGYCLGYGFSDTPTCTRAEFEDNQLTLMPSTRFLKKPRNKHSTN